MLPALLVALSVVLRVVPHPLNFAPVGASAVLAGRTLKPWTAMALLAVAMFTGDLILSAMNGYAVANAVTPFVYAGFFAQAMLGRLLRRKKGGAIGAALLGSLAFFALSNFGVWVAGIGIYPHTAAGFLACYVAAIPFYGRTVLGDVLWVVVLSAMYRLLATRLASRRSWVPASTEDLSVV
jgi:hypothetical protein